eukprot:CAMPEP_0168333494 /NCGR_PEP_ID=MMETSP0213-20121227/9641_1 /TAXON_ID=151035 /ORGANISM="Euplotes harpa, Strain FSP1.4" /LENGTH=95 /DNA_ID=CAMNT_0008337829 /DNA_START=36 /DNA_END=323 /DNA_ORIENTATION=+
MQAFHYPTEIENSGVFPRLNDYTKMNLYMMDWVSHDPYTNPSFASVGKPPHQDKSSSLIPQFIESFSESTLVVLFALAVKRTHSVVIAMIAVTNW